MKYIYSFFVLVLLLTSCSKTEFVTKTPDKKANSVISEVEAKNAVTNYTWEYGRNQTTPENPRNYYWDAYSKLQAMLNGQQKASFKNAVFITENAWYDNRLSYNNYNNYIQTLASVCKAWKKANPLLKYYDDDSIRIALSGAVYKAMTDTLKDEKGKIISVPYSYNFNDAFADKYWADRFVTNLMETHKGNCHSLPFLYKIVAEELNVPAYLSFMPEHIYIKQYSKQYNWYNTELTSKSFPVDAWLMASGYVSTASIVSGIYMDTLSLKQSIAVCVNDLAKGYAREIGNKDGVSGLQDLQFVVNCCNLGLTYYPNYAELLLLKAETLKKLGKDHYDEMEKTYSDLAALDYREIPDAMYYRWMSSLVKGDSIWNREADSSIKPTNPFTSIHKTPKGYLTLSNGYYDENYTNDTLRQIGSVVLNTVTNKVDHFIQNNEQVERPKDNSRFLSVDPIEKQFPELSPYQYAGNTPIWAKDLDGKEPAYYQQDNTLGTLYVPSSDQIQHEVPPSAQYLNKTVEPTPTPAILTTFQIAFTGYDDQGNKIDAPGRAAAILEVVSLGFIGEAEEGAGFEGTGGGEEFGGGIKPKDNVAPKVKPGDGDGVHGNSVKSEKPTGTYTNTHESGKTYDGVGPKKRMNQSAKKIKQEHNDPVVKQEHSQVKNRKDAYLKEHENIEKHGGAGNKEKNYNKNNSPGKKLSESQKQ